MISNETLREVMLENRAEVMMHTVDRRAHRGRCHTRPHRALRPSHRAGRRECPQDEGIRKVRIQDLIDPVGQDFKGGNLK